MADKNRLGKSLSDIVEENKPPQDRPGLDVILPTTAPAKPPTPLTQDDINSFAKLAEVQPARVVEWIREGFTPIYEDPESGKRVDLDKGQMDAIPDNDFHRYVMGMALSRNGLPVGTEYTGKENSETTDFNSLGAAVERIERILAGSEGPYLATAVYKIKLRKHGKRKWRVTWYSRNPKKGEWRT